MTRLAHKAERIPRTWRGGAERPPWTDEAAIRMECTSCGDCIAACPEAILISGPAGTPQINFHLGECTFCGACAKACRQPVFRDTREAPWDNMAKVGAGCLLKRGVACRSCIDTCEPRALRFDLRARPIGAITLDVDACTGCGACVAGCPVDAISIEPNAKANQ